MGIFEDVNTLARRINGNEIDLINIDAYTVLDENNDISYCRINSEGMTDLFKKLYGQTTSNTIRRDYYCYWVGTMGWTGPKN